MASSGRAAPQPASRAPDRVHRRSGRHQRVDDKCRVQLACRAGKARQDQGHPDRSGSWLATTPLATRFHAYAKASPEPPGSPDRSPEQRLCRKRRLTYLSGSWSGSAKRPLMRPISGHRARREISRTQVHPRVMAARSATPRLRDDVRAGLQQPLDRVEAVNQTFGIVEAVDAR